MSIADAQATADRLNNKDAGVLTYSVLSVGNDAIIMVCCAITGRFFGEL